jgi:transposase-like protein
LNTFYTFFLIIISIATVVSFYLLYIQSKIKKFDSFNDRVCPKCKSTNVEVERLRGDCATSEYKFSCNTCGYKSTHNISNRSGCSI